MTDPKLTHDGEYNADLPGGSEFTSTVHKQKQGSPTNDPGCWKMLGWGCFAVMFIPMMFVAFFVIRHQVNIAVGHVPCVYLDSMLDFHTRLNEGTTLDDITVRVNENNGQLYVYTDRRRCYIGHMHITPYSRRSVPPDLYPSPDGNYIAVTGNLFGNSDSYILELQEGSGRLTALPDKLNNPVSWSPDSNTMAFMGYEGDDFVLKTLNVADYTITQPDLDALPRYAFVDIHWVNTEQFMLHTDDFDGSIPDCNRPSQLTLIDLVDADQPPTSQARSAATSTAWKSFRRWGSSPLI
jgi:hypothetical protein